MLNYNKFRGPTPRQLTCCSDSYRQFSTFFLRRLENIKIEAHITSDFSTHLSSFIKALEHFSPLRISKQESIDTLSKIVVFLICFLAIHDSKVCSGFNRHSVYLRVPKFVQAVIIRICIKSISNNKDSGVTEGTLIQNFSIEQNIRLLFDMTVSDWRKVLSSSSFSYLVSNQDKLNELRTKIFLLLTEAGFKLDESIISQVTMSSLDKSLPYNPTSESDQILIDSDDPDFIIYVSSCLNYLLSVFRYPENVEDFSGIINIDYQYSLGLYGFRNSGTTQDEFIIQQSMFTSNKLETQFLFCHFLQILKPKFSSANQLIAGDLIINVDVVSQYQAWVGYLSSSVVATNKGEKTVSPTPVNSGQNWGGRKKNNKNRKGNTSNGASNESGTLGTGSNLLSTSRDDSPNPGDNKSQRGYHSLAGPLHTTPGSYFLVSERGNINRYTLSLAGRSGDNPFRIRSRNFHSSVRSAMPDLSLAVIKTISDATANVMANPTSLSPVPGPAPIAQQAVESLGSTMLKPISGMIANYTDPLVKAFTISVITVGGISLIGCTYLYKLYLIQDFLGILQQIESSGVRHIIEGSQVLSNFNLNTVEIIYLKFGHLHSDVTHENIELVLKFCIRNRSPQYICGYFVDFSNQL